MATRRQFLKAGAAVGAGALIRWQLDPAHGSLFALSRALASAGYGQTPLAPDTVPQFAEPLPTFVGSRVRDTALTISMQEFQQKILPNDVYAGLKPPFDAGTYVWGYKVGDRPASYPGYTVEGRAGAPITVTYVNTLPLPAASQLAKALTVDQTIHWADPLQQMGATSAYSGPVPAVVHLHGGVVPSAFDGAPEAWFTTDGRRGKGYGTLAPAASNAAIFQYLNDQPATTLWFHDHALGLTRINVFAGLAAFYLIRDQYDTGRPDNPLRLPAGAQEIELLIQDRQFDTNGQLVFPDGSPASDPVGLNGSPPNPSIHPYWVPEFFGDVIVVNGKAWPYLEVEPRRYRLRMVDGANARFFRMRLVDSANGGDGPALWQIGTDGGLLDGPVKLGDSSTALPLFLGPGERADVIVDFTGLAGRSFTMVNDAPAPFPDGDKPDAATTGRIMQFRVIRPLSAPDQTYDPASGAPLRGGASQPPAVVRLADPAGTLAAGVQPSIKRLLVLVEVESDENPVEALLNNSKWHGMAEGTMSPLPDSRPDPMGQGFNITELPVVGDTEEWDIVNLTEDAHPIHIHLVQFQLINRQPLDKDRYRTAYDALFPGGQYAGLTSQMTWGMATYPSGVFIPGFGPPRPYGLPNTDGALGGNPDVRPYLQGGPIAPDSNEAGWKDTIKVLPGQVTRLVIRWAPITTPAGSVKAGQNLYPFDPTTGPGYVWHCHILDHEDNEMMRPYLPVAEPQLRTLGRGTSVSSTLAGSHGGAFAYIALSGDGSSVTVGARFGGVDANNKGVGLEVFGPSGLASSATQAAGGASVAFPTQPAITYAVRIFNYVAGSQLTYTLNAT